MSLYRSGGVQHLKILITEVTKKNSKFEMFHPS